MNRRSDWMLFAGLSLWASVAWAQETLVRYFGTELAQIPVVTWLCVAAYALAGTLARLQADLKSGEVEKKLFDIGFVLLLGQIVGHLMFLVCEGAMSRAGGHMPYWLEGLMIFGAAFNRKRFLDCLSDAVKRTLEKVSALIGKLTG